MKIGVGEDGGQGEESLLFREGVFNLWRLDKFVKRSNLCESGGYLTVVLNEGQ